MPAVVDYYAAVLIGHMTCLACASVRPSVTYGILTQNQKAWGTKIMRTFAGQE